jgi:hypothetical protein
MCIVILSILSFKIIISSIHFSDLILHNFFENFYAYK